jgi:hypothetical protein
MDNQEPQQPAPSPPQPQASPPPAPPAAPAQSAGDGGNQAQPPVTPDEAGASVLTAQPQESGNEKKGIPTLLVIVAILLGVSLIVVGFFAYENYQLRQVADLPAYLTSSQ